MAIILVGSSCCCERNGGYSSGDIRFSVYNQRHGFVLHLKAAMILLFFMTMLLIEMAISRQLVQPDLDLLAFLRLQKASLLLLQAISQHENLRHLFKVVLLFQAFCYQTLLFPLLLFVFYIFSRSLVNERTTLLVLLLFSISFFLPQPQKKKAISSV